MRRTRYHELMLFAVGCATEAFWDGFAGRPLAEQGNIAADSHRRGIDGRSSLNVSRRRAKKWASRKVKTLRLMHMRNLGHHAAPSFFGV